MLPRKNLFIAGTLAVGLMSLGQFCSADAISDSQIGQLTMVKFLVGLSRFITWPDSSFSSPTAAFNYCIAGNDDIGHVLDDAMANVTVGDRKAVVRRIALDDSSVNTCHLVYLGVEDVEEAIPIIDSLSTAPIVTIAQVEGFTDVGGMVQFIGTDRNVRLQVNRSRLEATKLYVSSKLYGASEVR